MISFIENNLQISLFKFFYQLHDELFLVDFLKLFNLVFFIQEQHKKNSVEDLKVHLQLKKYLHDRLFFLTGSIRLGSKNLLPKYALLIPPFLTNFFNKR